MRTDNLVGNLELFCICGFLNPDIFEIFHSRIMYFEFLRFWIFWAFGSLDYLFLFFPLKLELWYLHFRIFRILDYLFWFLEFSQIPISSKEFITPQNVDTIW